MAMYCCAFFVALLAVLIGLLYVNRIFLLVGVMQSQSLAVQSLMLSLERLGAGADLIEWKKNTQSMLDGFADFMVDAVVFPDKDAAMEQQIQRMRLLERASFPPRDGRGDPIAVFVSRDAELPLSTKTPCFIYLHGGALAIRFPEKLLLGGNHGLMVEAERQGAGALTVVSVHYRLMPEHVFPAAIHDVQDTLAWVRANADRFGIDTAKIFIGGESAGGLLTVAAALAEILSPHPTTKDFPPLAAIAPSVPHLDNVASRAVWYPGTQNWHPDPKLFTTVCNTYCSPESYCDQSNPLVSPLEAPTEILAKLPPVVLKSHGRGFFSDHSESFSWVLRKVNHPRVHHLRCPHCVHATLLDRKAHNEHYLYALKKIVARI